MLGLIQETFAAFKRIPLRVLIITALASYILLAVAILEGQPFYVMVVYTLVPWVPVFFFASIWKYEHYGWITVFAIMAVLQVGHVGEHVAQITQLRVLDGTLACPPPVDSGENVARAVQAGLRPLSAEATGISSQWVIKPNAAGFAAVGVDGVPIRGVDPVWWTGR